MKYIIISIFIFLVSAVLPVNANASTKYVNSSGSDDHDGTSEKPWKTIQKAADSADDEIVVQDGEYNENININKPNLKFRALGSVKVKGFSINSDGVLISGFDVSENGIDIKSNNCQIEGNMIHDTKNEGVKLLNAITGCKIKNNKIRRPRRGGIVTPASGQSSSSNEIENNEITEVIVDITPSPAPQVTIKRGDANSDGKVDLIDFTDHWLLNYLKMVKGIIFGDFDNNGNVDGVDYVIWLNNFGK